LFLIVSSISEDKLIEVVSRHKATLMRMDLSPEDLEKLHDAFGPGVVAT
jgi:uncharacterized membrane protein